MAAEDSFRAGRLAQALAELQADIRRKPADPALRVFLAQLLMIGGDWKRAHAQMETLVQLDASAIPMARTYQNLIQCEQFREEAFAGARSPLMLGEPQPWLAMLVQALAELANGRVAEAAALRARALDEAPATAGTVDGTAFEWIADADSRIGPVVEVFLKGYYYWVPFASVSRIVIEAPTDARDTVFLPATFTWSNGGEAIGFLPARYPGSHASDEDAIRLSRQTTWQQLDESTWVGSGQKVLCTEAAEFAVLDLRELTLASSG